jgi:predicted alpha/beta-fold hydrolase
VTTPDGDFVDLDWQDGAPGAPLVLVLHGLEGCARSHYVVGVLDLVRARGWRGVVLNFRSCSGELNRLPRFYHSGDTADLDLVVQRLVQREGDVRLAIVGVSLGGNVLVKWLGERGDRVPAAVEAGVGISVPFDLAACAEVLRRRGFGRWVYTANFLRSMRAKVAEKARAYPGFVDLEAVRRARTFHDYDAAVTAPLHGFASARDYWTRASCKPYVAGVRRPLLLINAVDDPFIPLSCLPDPRTLPPGVRAEFTPHGGHVGFWEGAWPWQVRPWAERRAVDFVAGVVAGQPGRRGAGPPARPRRLEASAR